MYNELNKFISCDFTVDQWYDDGFIIAQDILSSFSSNDWLELYNNVLNHNLDWQKKIIYCLDNETTENELDVILKLMETNDEELFDMCIDTLRSFDVKKIREIILLNPTIISRVKERIKSAGIATKGILQNFLDNLNK